MHKVCMRGRVTGYGEWKWGVEENGGYESGNSLLMEN